MHCRRTSLYSSLSFAAFLVLPFATICSQHAKSLDLIKQEPEMETWQLLAYLPDYTAQEDNAVDIWQLKHLQISL